MATMNHLVTFATWEEADAALRRVLEHPLCTDPDNWSIDHEAFHNGKPGFALFSEGHLDAESKRLWFERATGAPDGTG